MRHRKCRWAAQKTEAPCNLEVLNEGKSGYPIKPINKVVLGRLPT